MPWYFPWSESIKKRACRYLLHHYLGDFLKEKLDLDQLSVDLYNGKGTIKEVPLDVWALNEMLSNSGIPIELVDGYIESISVSVPWKALLNDSCEICIHGLNLTFAGRQKPEGSLVESINSWSSMSMTTSIQMAQECLRQDPTLNEQEDSSQAFEGLEAFAQTIESVLARVRLSFVNTKIRLEHIPVSATSGVGVDLVVDRVDYWDLSHEEIGKENTPQHSVYEPVAIAIKNFQMYGVNMYIEEFPRHKRTRLRDLYGSDEDLSESPLGHHSEGYSHLQHKVLSEDEASNLLPKVKFLSSCGKQNIKIKLKQNEAIPGPKFDMEYSMAALNVFLTPRQFHLLSDVGSALSENASAYSDSSSITKETTGHHHHSRSKMREMKSEDFMKVEESLQSQFHSIDPDWKTALNSLNSTNDSLVDNFARNRANSEEEFFSMSEFPLPSLGQPTLLNTVKQCNLTGNSAEDITGRFSPTSPRSTLSNISLGGSSGSLTSRGTLTEKASTIIRGSSGSPGQLFHHGFVTSPGGSTGVGLAGVSKLDDTGDSTRIRLRTSNIIVVISHRDPLPGLSARVENDSTLEEMSSTFFQHVNQYAIQSLFGLNGDDVRENLLHICAFDHLRILASALSVEAETSTLSQNMDLVVGKLSVEENLFEESLKTRKPYSLVQVIHFDQQDISPLYPGTFGTSQSPCLKIKMQKCLKTGTGVHSRGTMPPKSQINLEFGPLIVDFDMTMIDRIVALTKPGPLYKTNVYGKPNLSDMYNSLATGKSANQQTAYKQVLYDTSMNNDYKTDVTCKCANARIFLRIPVPDLRASSNIEKKPWWRRSVHSEYLQIDVMSLELKTTLLPSPHPPSSSYEVGFRKAKGVFLAKGRHYHVFDIATTTEEGDTGSMGVDMPRILINITPPSSRSVFEENERLSKDSSPDSIEDQYPWMKSEPSPFSSQPNMYNENEEMVTPGSVNEMNTFQEYASSSSKMSVNCYFPSMRLNLHTNDVFELFYNRLLGDFVMWEPDAPSPGEATNRQTNPYDNVHINLASHIGQFDGAFNNGGDKFFMCRSAIRGDTYDSHSTADESFFSGDFFHDNYYDKHGQQTNLCFSLHIDQGKVAMFPPSTVITDPSLTKDVTLQQQEIDTCLGHVVLNVKNAHLFVASGFRGKSNTDFIELYSNTVEFYHNSLVSEAVDMLIMEEAVSIDYLEQTIYPSVPSVQQKCKNSMSGENGAMLSLAMKSVSNPDAKRKDNTLSVAVSGGTLNHRIVQSGHSWLTQVMAFMAIDDYPITGYTFPTVMTTLHLHLWGCAVDYRPLHIPIHSLLTMESFSLSSNIIPGSSTSILRFIIEDSALHLCDRSINDSCDFDEFVSVLDMGTFELSLKFNSGEDKKQPLTDLSMSNNLLNIRTCADSCVALMKLVQYFASDGDLQSGIVTESNEKEFPESSESANMPIMEGQQCDESADIHFLMDDAMNDTEDSIDDRFQGTVIDECDDTDDEDESGDEYCLLDNEQAMPKEDFDPIVNKLIDQDIAMVENFIQIPQGKHDQLLSPGHYPPAMYRYTIKEMCVVWQMYGGSDFTIQRSNSFSSTGRKQMNTGSPLSKAKIDSSKINRANRVKGGPNRDLDTLMELHLNKIRFQHEIFPETAKQIYRDVLLVYDIEVRDRLASSMINKFLYRFSSENIPKQSSANMISIRLLVTKPEDKARSEEASLRVSLQPLRFNVDQDSLFFLRDFFTRISSTSSSSSTQSRPPSVNRPPSVGGVDYSSSPNNVYLSSSPSATNVEPFQNVYSSSPSAASPQFNQPRAMANDVMPLKNATSSESLKSSEAPSLFIKSFLFSPEVPIRLDYQGKYVNIEQGTLAGLIMGLSQLNCSELRLKRLCSRSGLLGADKLIAFIITEWLNDIKQHQLQSILGGVGPAYSFMKLFQGLKDLFWMPVQQYRQDGRIVRGFQRGAHSFSTSTAMAVLELSNRLVSTMQSLAELTFDMVSSGPSHVSSRGSNIQATHPAELREGIANAYTVLTEGLSETASNLVRVATEEHEKKGMTGAVGGVLRQIPPTVVKPLILATEATSNVLGGAMNQLQPDKRKEALEKWKTADS